MKIKVLITALLFFTLSGFSQTHDEKRAQIKALKVTYLTTELKLTTEEADKFWPVYNAYEEKQYNIRHNKIKPLLRQIGNGALEKMSEKEAQVYLDKFQDADEELFYLRKKLINDLKPIIGSVKLIKLKKVEDDFNKKLLEKYKDKDKEKKD
ncbi:sensor of ECF-type sigma factor [Flavobacterium sp. Sd200]|uniref:sensor of ECF-type sigma factor n=1 Tax=Flavobacterium sp. Sd200 TaxID=2692211 RepID=UPI00136BC4AD|nr:sensor of ECF-type sigma factor [Flavobacterium sp. Sd200]MXN90439.1 sensor of ECF-type sigma factor [Flavobacterium sp. Sd200]